MQTIQIFVGCAHTVPSIDITAEVTIGYKRLSGAISFIPTGKQDLLLEGSYTFKYNSQKSHTNKES